MAYRVIKWVKGIAYAYMQRSYREGGKVRTESTYLGPVSGSGRSRASGKATDGAGGADTAKDRKKAATKRERECAAMIADMERTAPDTFERLRAAYEPAHRETNRALYAYVSNFEMRDAWAWKISARLFGYYNRRGSEKNAGVRSFGNRRDWREECARELVAIRKPGGLASFEREAKNGLKAARASLTLTRKRRTWGSYRRRTLRKAEARIRLQELRIERLRIVSGLLAG